MYKASVILPVYNESAIIEKTLLAVTAYAQQHPDYYFLFVNDGSTDNTAGLIKKKLSNAGNVALKNLEKNVGKAEAIELSLAELTSDYIIFTDGDLAYSLDHIDKVMEALKNSDIAIG